MSEIEVYKDSAGEYRWRKRAGNGEIVADSSEGYTTETGAFSAAQREAKPEDHIVVMTETEKHG